MIDYMLARIPSSDIPCYIFDNSFLVVSPSLLDYFPISDGIAEYYWYLESSESTFDLESVNLLIFSLEDKFGFASTLNSSIVVNAIWDWASKFHNGFALVNKGCMIPSDDDIAQETLPRDGKFGIINLKGEIVLDPIYDKITFPQKYVKEDVLFTAYYDDNIFVFDKNGKIVLQPEIK